MNLRNMFYKCFLIILFIVSVINIFSFFQKNKDIYINLYKLVRVSRITDVVAINDPLAEIKVIAKDFNDRTSEEGVVYFFRTTEGWKIHYAYSFFPSKLVELVAADLEETEFCSRLNKEDLVIVATGQSVQSGCLVEQHKYKGFSTYVKND